MRLFGRARLALLAGLCGAIAGGCLPIPGSTRPIHVADGLAGEFRVSGAAHPRGMAFASDGRVFYNEKNTGRIRVLTENGLLGAPFAEVPVNSAGDRGLLGIALHPNFPTTPRVYVFYTRSDTGASTSDPQAVVDNRVVYFNAAGDVADGGEVFVASLPASTGDERVGGWITFAADGKLLVTIGDLSDSAGAADPNVLVGKVLRFNDDGTIPADNPTAGSPVFARGLRDPGGICIDPTDAAVFVIDNGENGVGEVDRVPAGADLGWPAVTGKADTTAELEYAAANPSYVDPIFTTPADTGLLEGASFNPSTRYGPGARFQFFYGEVNRKRVIEGVFNTERTAFSSTPAFARDFPEAVRNVAFTPAGTLYVATEHAVMRIVPSPP